MNHQVWSYHWTDISEKPRCSMQFSSTREGPQIGRPEFPSWSDPTSQKFCSIPSHHYQGEKIGIIVTRRELPILTFTLLPIVILSHHLIVIPQDVETKANMGYRYYKILLSSPTKCRASWKIFHVRLLSLFSPFYQQSIVHFIFKFVRASNQFTCTISNFLALTIEKGYIVWR